MKPECFVINFRNSFHAFPAKVIKEGKATITVAVLREDGSEEYRKVFNKQKNHFGETEYYDPRILTPSHGSIRGQLEERGSYYSNPYYLTFDVENVLIRLEKERVQKDFNSRARKLQTEVNNFLSYCYNFHNTPENVARLEALEKALTISV